MLTPTFTQRAGLYAGSLNQTCVAEARTFHRIAIALFWLVSAIHAETPTFQHHVLPLFSQRCLACHGDSKTPMAGLDLRSLETIMAGSSRGPIIVPSKPEASRLLTLIKEGKMPVGGPSLSPAEIQLIEEWIAKGQFPSVHDALAAKRKRAISDEARQWWSFRKPVTPLLPKVGHPAKISTAIDAFVEHKLEERRWTLGPPADQRTLVRRIYLDLLGLPPTPEQLRTFLADSRPNAYERLIDTLLASPHYGERWARHWLDVAGYADSIGNSTDEVRTLAWRYRDYVIRSFNADKPYNHFLLEQFAGDQLVNFDPKKKPKPEDIEALTATGFLRVPPDYGDQQPIYQVDKYYDALQATVETSLKATMGLQLACARCHDHKFDPLLQEDYYKLTAAFQPALDPDKWIPATSFSYGTWPSRHILNVEPQDRDAWIAAIKDHYTKARRAKQSFTAAIAKLRRQDGDNGADPADTPDDAPDAELESRHPEVARLREAMRDSEESYKKLDSQRIWALWDVSTISSPTRILTRGDYQSPGEPVSFGIPAVLDNPANPFQPPEQQTTWNHTGRRLALARWLTRPDHPLTARVIVNRVWQYHFGEGIVRTPDDFGSQGVAPTHPELLDWLATEFVENGWSFKWLHRQILMSAVYRQSSAENRLKLAADPDNKLLWRKAPLRLEAEVIRDSILHVSGKLNLDLYGEPVPVRKTGDGQYVLDAPSGDRQRRSIYVLTRKSTPLSFLLAFDQPTMDAGNMPVRFRSALPVQALALMNSTFVYEQAAWLAKLITEDAAPGFAAKVKRAYELVYLRPPRPEELRLIHAELEPKSNDLATWREFCHALLVSNEFLYSF